MNKKIRIVFLYRELTFWLNNHSLYKECLWDGNFDIWVVPESNYIDPETLSILKEDKVKIIEKNIKDNKYFDLKRLNPDYVLIATPYKDQRNKIYNAEYLQKFTKVLYIPYGIGPQKDINKDYFNEELKFISYFFCENDFKKELFSKFLDKNIIVNTGYPLFDLFNEKYNKVFIKNKEISKKTILWTPHWTIKPWGYLDNKNNDKIGNSDFIKYADLWLKIPKLYPNINFIMRPHPDLFTRLPKETNNEWTKEKIESWKKEFLSNSNVKIENSNSNFLLQFFESSCIINSCQSFIIIYLLTQKPFLLTSPEENCDDYGKNIIKSYYKANNEQDIINFIDNVIINDNDTMKKYRKNTMQQYIYIPDGGSGLFIKNFIKTDFKEIKNNKLNIKQLFINKYYLKKK